MPDPFGDLHAVPAQPALWGQQTLRSQQFEGAAAAGEVLPLSQDDPPGVTEMPSLPAAEDQQRDEGHRSHRASIGDGTKRVFCGRSRMKALPTLSIVAVPASPPPPVNSDTFVPSRSAIVGSGKSSANRR